MLYNSRSERVAGRCSRGVEGTGGGEAIGEKIESGVKRESISREERFRRRWGGRQGGVPKSGYFRFGGKVNTDR